jgi:hypothetical protein
MSSYQLVNKFECWYRGLDLMRVSSSIRRRALITNWASGTSVVDGSLEDVESFVKYSGMNTTQRCIAADADVMKRALER